LSRKLKDISYTLSNQGLSLKQLFCRPYPVQKSLQITVCKEAFKENNDFMAYMTFGDWKVLAFYDIVSIIYMNIL